MPPKSPTPVKLVHLVTVPISLRTFFDGQIGYMKDSGLEVQAISSPGPLLEDFSETEDIRVHPVRMSRSISPFKDFLALLSLCFLLAKIRPEILHAHTPKAGLLGMIAGWVTRVPVRIYHIRGLPLVTMRGPRQWLLKATERIACRLAHRVLCVSHSVRSVAIDENLCTPEKIAVLCAGSGNGVDAEGRFNPQRMSISARNQIRESLGIAKEDVTLGFIGRFAKDKGFAELAKAWEALRVEFPKIHFLVIGGIDSRDPVPKAMVEKLRRDPRVHFIKQTQKIEKYYHSIDICVLPTYREGLPNVLLEAGAMECAVVSTQVPGCVDVVVDGETGLLVAARDSGALQLAIRKYLQSTELRAQHGESARQRVVENFRQEKIWSALREEYHRLGTLKGLDFPLREDVWKEKKRRAAA